MDPLALTLRLSAGVVLVLANAFFVATEFALTRLPQYDESEFQDSAALRRAWSMLDRLEIYLTGCQLGITTSSILLGIVAEPAVTALLEPVVSMLGITGPTASVVSVVAAVVLINLIHKIWGEQAPTYIGVERPKTIARLTAPLHYGWTTLTYPFIVLGDGLAKWTLALFGVEIQRSWTETETEETSGTNGNRAELTRKMAELLRRRNIPADRREEVLNALEIGTLPVRDVMVPRDDVVALSTERSLQENLDVLASQPLHSRYPLTGPSLDDVKGFVYVPAMMRAWNVLREGSADLADVATPAVAVPPDCPVSDVIDRLQSEDHEVALIAADGRTVGLVTITDAFEAIVGDMQDPFDEGEDATEPRPHAAAV